MGAKPPHLLKPQEVLEVQSTDLLTREETGWLPSGPTLGPLSQPLGALLKGEHENDLWREGKERKVQGDPGTRP